MIEQSVFLWGLPLLLLPWLLRLIKTQKPLHVHFSQSYLLKKVIDAYRPKKRKNPWWLILLRMLILLIFILLIAGILIPQARSRGPMSLIVLLDDSLYSRSQIQKGKTLWNACIDKALNEMSGYSLQTKVALVTSTGRSTEWLSLSQAKLILSQKQASYQLENWNHVKGQLQRLLRKREHDDLSLIMIGDGKSTQPGGFSSCLNQWPNQNITIHKIDNPPHKNYSITASAKPNAKGTLLEIHITGPSEINELKLEVQDKSGLTKNKTLKWQGIPNYTQWRLEGQNWKQGKLSLNVLDRFNFDNQVYFNVEESNYQQLILLQHQQAEKRLQDSGYYLEKALKSLAFQQNFEFRSISPRGWKSLNGGKGDLLILHDPPFLSKAESEKIAQFTRRGGKTIIMCGPLTSPDALSENLGDALPAYPKEQSRKNLRLELPELWKEQLPRLAKTQLRGNWLFYQLKQDTQVLMRLEDGSPFWTKRELGQGELHLLSSPFHIMYSDALIRNDLLTMLKLLTEFIYQDNKSDELFLNAGKPAPSEIESVLPILSDHDNFDPSFVHPGIYEAQYLGRNMFLSCNAPVIIDTERLPILNHLDHQEGLSSISNPNKRIDVELVIFLLFLLLLETFALQQLQKPSYKKAIQT
jgi:hypothetical protein